MNTLLKASALALVTVLAAGCSSNAERIDAVDATAQQAQVNAQQAQATAQQALSAAQQAQATADEANERAARMLSRTVRK